MSKTLRVACLLVLSACSSADVPGAGGAVSPPSDIQLSITNGTGSRLSVYMVWNGGRTRLGDIGPGRTREFTPPYRAPEIAIGVDDAAAPPSGTSAAPSGFNPTQNARESNLLLSGAVAVDPGDIFVIDIRALTPRLNVLWREVNP